MTHPESRYVYGPVPSRRLGRSLGIDLVPFKTCTYDCIYCQLGRTTHLTLERKAYTPAEALVDECRKTLETKEKPDIISLAGSGEPTLNSAIGDVIRGIKKWTAIPVAVLTNGSLLWQRDVQDALMAADLVLPSLDAGDDDLFQRVNRPHPALSFETMVDGLAAFTRRFGGEVWLEVLLTAGMTGVPGEVEKIATHVGRIRPARVQLNTVCRPPAEAQARALSAGQMRTLAGCFPGRVDIISRDEPGGAAAAETGADMEADLMALLERRPCTARDVATGLGLHVNHVLKHLEALAASERLARVVRDEQTYYTLPPRKS
jgi:wyosine [tRNA(Phe)-imidazoG37] synthetase (radical SAM superfamily)